MPKRGKIVVVTGPSGVGKSTILTDALARTGAEFSVSATTRQPRPNELDGREYYFVDRPAFEGMIACGELLEWADNYGQLYGTPAGPVFEAIESGKTVVLDIDIQGAEQVHAKLPDATYIFIAPPDDETLRKRLTDRGTETPQAVERRLENVAQEMAAAKESGLYTLTVVNDDLDQAVRQVARAIEQERP